MAAFGGSTLLPVIVMISWLVVGLPLLLAGDFSPELMLLLGCPLAAALAVVALHQVPGGWPGGLPGPDRPRAWKSLVATAGTVVVAAGFTAWQLMLNSTAIIATRTPGASFQAGYWIAQHGRLPITGSLAVFGGTHAAVHLSSIGFFQQGSSVVPAVNAGLPMLLAAGFWAGGVGGGAVIGPVLGGLAILSFAGLVGRLAGQHWAPAGALVLALTLPELYVSRASFTEPAVQVLLFGGLSLVVDALTPALLPGASRAGPAQLAARRTARQPATVTAPLAETEGHGMETAVLRQDTEDGARPAGPGDAADAGSTSGPTEPATAPHPGPPRAAAATKRMAGRPRQLAQLSRRLLARGRRRIPSAGWTGWMTPRWVPGALGGLALGLTALLTPGALIYLLPVIPAGAVIAIGRRQTAIAFGLACAAGIGAGLTAGYVLARPFFDSLSPELELLGLACWVTGAVTIATWALLQVPGIRAFVRKALAKMPLRWVPEIGCALIVTAVGFLFARPYLGKVRGPPYRDVASYVAALQRTQHLVVDPARLYSEDTVYWLIWYIGAPALLLGTFGAALLVRRSLRALLAWQDPDGAWRNWALPLALMLGGTASVLWQPHTVPDQPWASRRLVPLILPGLTLTAIWASAWLSRRARERGAGPVTAGAVGLFCVGAMVLPAGATAFGIGLAHSGTGGGLRLSAAGLAQHRTGAGQQQAVRGLCSGIGRTSAVVIVDRRVAQDFSQLIRGMCGVPAAWELGQHPAGLAAVLASIARAGRQPVVLGATSRQVAAYGQPLQVLNLATTQNPHLLTQPPRGPQQVRYQIWMARVSAPAGGA